jgi:rhodanese-related sulfurtransferase
MNFFQIVLILLAGFIVYTFVKKLLLTKTIKQYSASEANEVVKKSRNAVLLDVRTSSERSAKQIKGSIHIPINELRNRSSELKKFQDKEIICYCRTGNRSLNAASMLKKQGFNSANLKGGIVSWNFN